jgi:hypothetical protein
MLLLLSVLAVALKAFGPDRARLARNFAAAAAFVMCLATLLSLSGYGGGGSSGPPPLPERQPGRTR